MTVRRERALRRRAVPRRIGALVAAVALTLTLGVGYGASSAAAAPMVPAAVPAPPAGSTAVSVRVGSDRIPGVAIAATGVAGVVLRMSSSETDPNAWAAYPWATCTSDADGDCTFVVPIRSGAPSTTGMASGARPWVHQVSAPAGYVLNQQVRVGHGNGTESVAFNYRFRINQGVAAGNTYRSTDPAFRFMITSLDPNDRDTSAGIWQVARANPIAQQSCGLSFGVLVDLSGSIDAAELADAKGALDTFVNALVGTPSSVALFNFDGTSPTKATQPNLPTPRSVRTTAEAAVVKASYAGWTTGSGTNWDAGLFAVAAAPYTYDAVIVLTDGNPTQYGTSASDRGNSSPNRVRDDEAGVFSANALKAKGTRVVALGVGDGAAGISSLNLAAISGHEQGVDFYQPESYQAAADHLAALAKGNCNGSIDVRKRVIPAGATVPANPTKAQLDAISAPAAGWQINPEAIASPASWGSPAGPWTTNAAGTATIPLKFASSTASAAVTWSESQRAGYVLQPVKADAAGAAQNAVCVNVNDGSVAAVTSGGTAQKPTVRLSTTSGTAMECTIYNRQESASVAVTKTWVVNGQSYAEGAQPSGITAQLSLTGPQGAGASPQPWGAVRAGYASGDAVSIAESTSFGGRTGCTLTSATVTRVNGHAASSPLTPGGYALTLQTGANTVEVTNVVTCVQSLALGKQVSFGHALPSAWTLTAAAPAGALAGPSGHDTGNASVRGAVTAAQPYTLSESGGSAAYVQVGAWVCTLTADPATSVPVSASTVQVPLGQDVTCVVTNATASLTLLKHVDGGSAVPADWDLTATPAPGAGLAATTVPGTDDPSAGNTAGTFEVRPGHAYALSEALAAPGGTLSYEFVRLEKRNADGTWTPQADAQITAPVAGESAVYRFVNAPRTPLALPLTGGTATDAFLLGGGILCAAALVWALLARRRRHANT